MLTAEKLRKAAILIDTLDADRAEALLSQMPPEQQQVIRNMVVELGDIDDSEREQVINEFLKPKSSGTKKSSQETKATNPSDHELATESNDVDSQPVTPYSMSSEPTSKRDGIDEYETVSEPKVPTVSNHSPTVEVSSGDTHKAERSTESDNENLIEPHTSEYSRGLQGWLSQLNNIEPERLARLMSLERPQAIAIILSQLEGPQAQQVVKLLDDDLRRAVLKRITMLEEVSEEILMELVQSLRQRLGQTEATLTIQLASPGIKALERILLAAEDQERGDLLSSLYEESPELVERLVSLHGWEAQFQQPSRGLEENGFSKPDVIPFPSLDKDSIKAHSQGLEPSTLELDEPTQAEQNCLSNPSDAESSHDDEAIADHLMGGLESLEQWHEHSLVFDQLMDLKDRSLIAVIRKAKVNRVLFAMLGADDRMLKKVKRALKRSEAKELVRRLNAFGPVRLSDVQKAQESIVDIAVSMMINGEIESLLEKRAA